MFKKLFRKLFGDSVASRLRSVDPDRWEASLLNRVREMSADDPLAGAKIGGKELAARLIEVIKSNGGVHVESLMCAAGALAGYACQAAVRANNRANCREELFGLHIASTDDGQDFLFGDPLNAFIAEAQYSIWSLTAGGAKSNGCKSLPDINPIFEHVANTIGTTDFGVPHLPEEHPVHEQPYAYLERFWLQFQPMVERFCSNPDHWPILYGFAIQDLLSKTKGILDPCISAKIVMESAVPMSKVQRRNT